MYVLCFWKNHQNISMMNLNHLFALSSVTKSFYLISKQISQYLLKIYNCMLVA